MMREIAALRLASRDRAAWEANRKRIRFEVREELEAMVGAEGEKEPEIETRSIFGRARFFRSVPDFQFLSSEDLLALARNSEERRLADGQTLPNPRDPKDSFFVVVDGALAIDGGAGEAARIPERALVAFSPGARPAASVGNGRLVRIEPNSLFELAQEEPRLVPACLRAARLPVAGTSAF